MATPPRRLILENINTVFGTIATPTYKTDVVTVEKVIKDWDSVPEDLRPWLGFMPQLETLQYFPGGKIRATLPIVVVGHVSAATKDLANAALEDLGDDLIKAMNLDTTRDANATMTTLVSSQDDVGDPDTIQRNSYSATLQQIWHVVYMRTTSGS